MEYPKTLTITVNNAEEEQQVQNFIVPKQEFPKMLYLHPADKTQEHKFIIVNTEGEMDAATDKGYKVEPYIPYKEAQGSGTERYGDAGTWTESTGEGLTDDTSANEETV